MKKYYINYFSNIEENIILDTFHTDAKKTYIILWFEIFYS